MKRIPLFQVDAFSEGPFTGNPAAVCPLDEWLPDEVMQSVAAENNLSETAFFVERQNREGHFDLRWFTPTEEVDLCGHATLASGHVVLNLLGGRTDRAREKVFFHTRSGQLSVERKGEMLALDIPAVQPLPHPDPGAADLIERVIGVRPLEVRDVGMPVVVLQSEHRLRGILPSGAAGPALLEAGISWLSVTDPADESDIDFVSRFFAPGSGIEEDPVTGSAHGWLVPFWTERLGRSKLEARQVSKRGGRLSCELVGDRVIVSGKVIDYLRGEVTLPLAR